MAQVGAGQRSTEHAANDATRPLHGSLAIIARTAVIGVASALLALSALAQTAKDVKGATPLVAIQNEAPPKLIVDPPIPEQLALGRVFIQYRTENLRILPVFGKAALDVSPRVGHLHITVDDLPWHWLDASGQPLSINGLLPGPHKLPPKCDRHLFPATGQFWSEPPGVLIVKPGRQSGVELSSQRPSLRSAMARPPPWPSMLNGSTSPARASRPSS